MSGLYTKPYKRKMASAKKLIIFIVSIAFVILIFKTWLDNVEQDLTVNKKTKVTKTEEVKENKSLESDVIKTENKNIDTKIVINNSSNEKPNNSSNQFTLSDLFKETLKIYNTNKINKVKQPAEIIITKKPDIPKKISSNKAKKNNIKVKSNLRVSKRNNDVKTSSNKKHSIVSDDSFLFSKEKDTQFSNAEIRQLIFSSEKKLQKNSENID
ncbi:MAG: hypothetical protein OEV44_11050 [Spirochaetota bacterium]|nr:hypothetical protein [Spirochaetota bacterium]